MSTFGKPTARCLKWTNGRLHPLALHETRSAVLWPRSLLLTEAGHRLPLYPVSAQIEDVHL